MKLADSKELESAKAIVSAGDLCFFCDFVTYILVLIKTFMRIIFQL